MGEFERIHHTRFGFISQEKDLVVESIQVESISHDEHTLRECVNDNHVVNQVLTSKTVVMGGEARTTNFYKRSELAIGSLVHGPGVIIEQTSTIVIEPGWAAELTSNGDHINSHWLKKTHSPVNPFTATMSPSTA